MIECTLWPSYSRPEARKPCLAAHSHMERYLSPAHIRERRVQNEVLPAPGAKVQPKKGHMPPQRHRYRESSGFGAQSSTKSSKVSYRRLRGGFALNAQCGCLVWIHHFDTSLHYISPRETDIIRHSTHSDYHTIRSLRALQLSHLPVMQCGSTGGFQVPCIYCIGGCLSSSVLSHTQA